MAINVTFGNTTPPGTCLPSSPLALIQFVAQYITGVVPGVYGQFVISQTTPSAGDQDKVWWKLDGSGNPIGFFSYNGSAWEPALPPFFFTGLNDIGALNAIQITLPVASSTNYPYPTYAFTGYQKGLTLLFKPAYTSTGAVTIQVNSFGAVAVYKGGTTPLQASDIQAGVWCLATYDGTAWQLVSAPFSSLLPIQRVYGTSGPITIPTSTGTYSYSTVLTLPSGATNWIDVDFSFAAQWISQNGSSSTITCTLQWNTAPLTNTTVTISGTAGCGNSGQVVSVADTGSQEAHTWNFKGEVPGAIVSASTITVQVSMVIAGGNLSATQPGYLWAQGRCK